MDFNNTPPKWDEQGTEPTTELQTKGFTAGYKPPAAYFNYLLHNYTECLKELQKKTKEEVEKLQTDKQEQIEVLPPEKGGTGEKNLPEAVKASIESLSIGINPIDDNTVFVSSEPENGVVNGVVYVKKSMSFLWSYLKGKIETVLGLTATNYGGTANAANCDADGEIIHTTYAKKSIYGDTAISFGRKSGSTVGTNSVAIGNNVVASGTNSHAEGKNTTALGDTSHAEGYSTNVMPTTITVTTDNQTIINSWNSKKFSLAKGNYSHVEGNDCLALGDYSHTEGGQVIAQGNYSHAEGNMTTASGEFSHVEGFNTTASGYSSHAEGNTTIASGEYSHAGGERTTASGYCSHAEGSYTTASGDYSHAEGGYTTASGDYSHAEGNNTTASGSSSHAEGNNTTALDYQHAQGHYNDTSIATTNSSSGTSTGTAFVIGNGTSSAKSNAFRVTGQGVTYAKGAYNSTGADYAEYAEWADGNPNNEDRRGYFVTFDETKTNMIRKANAGDYILGIVSGNPCIIGNSDEAWLGRYVFDEFGDYVYEEKEIDVEHTDPKTGEVTTTKETITTYKLNPDYDPTQEYVHRKDRKEWDAIGWIGVLSVRDDGSCTPGKYCKVADGGIATAAERGPDTYRVLERVTENIIKVAMR